jgi:MerR family transcriptional regulator, mercuric resistance operon regulatory protein
MGLAALKSDRDQRHCKMDSTYTIGRLAKAADVPVSTVRYYERRGLFAPKHRTSSSYRIYGEENLQRLRFIRAAQVAGFTLHDIAHLLELRSGVKDSCGEVQEIIEGRLQRVRVQLKELRRVQRVLKKSVEWCRSPGASGRCDAIAELDEQAGNL